MTSRSDTVSTADLREILDRGGMPQNARLAGLGLLRRLSGPVRVIVLGMPDSGKSSLVNMLIGAPLIPTGTRLPSLHLIFGETPRLTATLTDGDLVPVAGLSFTGLSQMAAQFAQIEVPAPFLQHLSLSEISMPLEAEAQKETVDQALRRADIVLWCSEGFTDRDREIWSGVPDETKDHAYLVLTNADKATADGSLARRMQVLAPVVEREFHSIYPVAALQGLAARHAGQPVQTRNWEDSGGAALVRSILEHAESGRLEDIGFANIFLSRYGTENQPAAPDPQPAAAQQSRAPSQPAVEFCGQAVTHLVGSAGQFAPLIRNPTPEADADILAQCVRVVEELVDLAAPLERSNDNAVVDDIHEAVEMITLLQLEGGAGPAADALALLAQIKDELEDVLAA